MYCVIEMFGDCEPWWFLEGWESDIIEKRQFADYYDALKYYKSRWEEMVACSPFYRSRSDLMTIFWDPKEKRWCEECNEDIQQYHSLFLLENECRISEDKFRPGYVKQNGTENHRACPVRIKTIQK